MLYYIFLLLLINLVQYLLYQLYKLYLVNNIVYINLLFFINNLNFFNFSKNIINYKLSYYNNLFFNKFYNKDAILNLPDLSNEKLVNERIIYVYNKTENDKNINYNKFIGNICSLNFNKNHPFFIEEIRKMEIDIIKITLDLFEIQNFYGTITYNDDESIMLLYRSLSSIKNDSEIIIGTNVNPKYFLLGKLFNFNIKKVSINKNKKLNIKEITSLINDNTIAIIISTPTYTHGIFEDIDLISKIISKKKIHFHIDISVSGIILPFIDKINFNYYKITSIITNYNYSLSPEKYSIILYNNINSLHNQYLIDINHHLNLKSTILGKESKYNIYTLWSTLLYFGKKYYKNMAKKISFLTIYLKNEINKINKFIVEGDPRYGLLSIVLKDGSIVSLHKELVKKGWIMEDLDIDELKFRIFHTYSTNVLDKFILDLKLLVFKQNNFIAPNKYNDILIEISKSYLDYYYSNFQKSPSSG